MAWIDGSKYIGQWMNDKMHGRGKIEFLNGTFYEGAWNNGR